MYMLSFLSLSAVALAFDAPESDVLAAFEVYKAQFGKRYALAEESARRANFNESLMAVLAGNAARASRGNDQTQGLNSLSDLSEREFQERYLVGLDSSPSSAIAGALRTDSCPACKRFPDLLRANQGANISFDWVEKGAVSSVKDQSG